MMPDPSNPAAAPSQPPVLVTLRPEKSVLPQSMAANLNLMVSIAVPALPAGPAPANGVNLALVLDRSGSMSGNRMRMAKRAASHIVNCLAPQDKVSLVTFDDEVSILASGLHGSHQETLRALIKGVDTRGSTDLHSGWLAGAKEVALHFVREGINRVILLSDGEANSGVVSAHEIARHVTSIRDTGVSTTTVGVGHDFNEDLLEMIAEAGDGNYHYADVAAELPALFARELSEQRLVTGLKVVVSFRLAQGVEVKPPLNQLPETETGGYRLGNLIAGKSHHVVVPVVFPAETADGPLLEVLVQWTDPSGVLHELVTPLHLPRTAPEAFAAEPGSPDVKRRALLLRNARDKRRIAMALKENRPETAKQFIEESILELESAPRHPELLLMLEKLRQESRKIHDGEYMSSMKTLKSQSARMWRKSELD